MIQVRSNKRIAIATVCALLVMATATAWAGTDGDEDVTVTAVFGDASPLVPGNEVRAAGVTVGEISSISLQQGKAHVEMALEHSVLPLHEDAQAVITDKDLLGERYVRLERGSPSAPLLSEPAVIAEEHTDRVVSLQEVLNVVDDPTGTALAALVTTLGEGASGQGPQIAAAIKALKPAMRRTSDLGRVLGEQNELLSRLVANAQPVAEAMAGKRGQRFDRLVGSTEQTLSAVAAERQAVEDTLQRLPGTLSKARKALARVAGVADSATPTLAGMRPITDNLPDISHELRRFADTADPALASLRPVLRRADKMLDEAAPLVAALRPAGPDIRGVSKSYRVLAEEALSGRLTNLMEFIKGWALSTTGYDQLGHFFRASIPLTPKALGQLAGGPVPGAPDSPVPDLPVPEGEPAPLPGPGEDPVGNALPGDSATGLSQEQENQMLSQLLGGQ